MGWVLGLFDFVVVVCLLVIVRKCSSFFLKTHC